MWKTTFFSFTWRTNSPSCKETALSGNPFEDKTSKCFLDWILEQIPDTQLRGWVLNGKKLNFLQKYGVPLCKVEGEVAAEEQEQGFILNCPPIHTEKCFCSRIWVSLMNLLLLLRILTDSLWIEIFDKFSWLMSVP